MEKRCKLIIDKVKETTKILNLIIDDAINGDINLENFYNRWPFDEENNDKFYSQMFEDLENAIEHTPFRFFSQKVNCKVWRNMNEYKTLLFYKSQIALK
jgi:hypothetical protein